MRPNKDPILNIGIILPVDKRKKVTISFSDAALYEIETEKLLISSCKTPDTVDILIEDGDMIIKKTVEAIDEHDITIHDVPAGRQVCRHPVDLAREQHTRGGCRL